MQLFLNRMCPEGLYVICILSIHLLNLVGVCIELANIAAVKKKYMSTKYKVHSTRVSLIMFFIYRPIYNIYVVYRLQYILSVCSPVAKRTVHILRWSPYCAESSVDHLTTILGIH